jgi:hypothetical protein
MRGISGKRPRLGKMRRTTPGCGAGMQKNLEIGRIGDLKTEITKG